MLFWFSLTCRSKGSSAKDFTSLLFFGIALFVVRLVVDLAQSITGIIDGSATATQSEEDRALKAEV